MRSNSVNKESPRVWVELAVVFAAVIALSFSFPAIKGLFGLLPLVYLLVERMVRKRSFAQIGFTPKTTARDIGSNWYWVLLVAVVFQVAVPMFAQAFVPEFLAHVVSRIPLFTPEQIVPLVISIFVGTFLEELVYRALLQGRLSLFLPPFAAIAVSSAVFAAMHFSPGPLPVVGYDIFTIFLDSLVYGVIYQRTKNVFASWGAHLLADIIALIALVLLF